LERIGEATSSRQKVVIDAGSKAIHAVGDMNADRTQEKARKASKAKARKASGPDLEAAPKTSPKASKPPEKVERQNRGTESGGEEDDADQITKPAASLHSIGRRSGQRVRRVERRVA